MTASSADLETEAQRLLHAWCAKPGNSQVKLGELLGVRRASVSDWIRGELRPGAENMVGLAVATKIRRLGHAVAWLPSQAPPPSRRWEDHGRATPRGE